MQIDSLKIKQNSLKTENSYLWGLAQTSEQIESLKQHSDDY